VVNTTQEPAATGTSAASGFTTGIVSYPGAANEDLMGYIAYASGEATRPGVIVLQEWWGLDDHIKEVTDRLAQEGFVALAPDLYHGVVTTEPDEARKQAMELGMRDAVAEIVQAISYLRELPEVNGQIGVVGFCMGGGLVLRTAAETDAADAAVVFYGQPLAADDAARVSAPVLSLLGSADGIGAARYESMHSVFAENGVANEFQLYEGAQHAFFNDTRASYDAEAAADAWQRTLAWFHANLSA
jgi:carboxymethylenebutenolidase